MMAVFGTVRDDSGYARLTRKLVHQWHAVGVPFCFREVFSGAGLPDDIVRARTGAGEPTHGDPVLGVYPIPQLTALVSMSPATHYYTMFEQEPLLSRDVEALRRGRLIVPSTHSASVAADAGLKADVVPLGVDTSVYHRHPSLTSDSVYHIVSVGTWGRRKGFDLLIKAFVQEFGPDEKVLLTIKTDPNPMGWQAVWREARSWGADRRVRILFDRMTDDGLAKLYSSADVFVLATRGEGFGLPILEAMACGLPVVVPQVGGHREFVRETDGYLVPVEKRLTNDQSGRYWWEMGVEDLRAGLRFAYQHRSEDDKRRIGLVARARKFTWGDFAAGVLGLMR